MFHNWRDVFLAGFILGVLANWLAVLLARHMAQHQAHKFIRQQKETAKSFCGHQMDGEIEILERWYEL